MNDYRRLAAILARAVLHPAIVGPRRARYEELARIALGAESDARLLDARLADFDAVEAAGAQRVARRAV